MLVIPVATFDLPPANALFNLQRIHQLRRREEPQTPVHVHDGLNTNSRRQMRLACAWPTNEHNVLSVNLGLVAHYWMQFNKVTPETARLLQHWRHAGK